MKTPFTLYIGLKIRSDDRLKKYVELLSSVWLSSSYSRVREIKLDVARAVSERIEQEGVVVPTYMKKGVFTTCDCDNLDHRKTSNISNKSVNGSMLTNTNHFTKENSDTFRDPVLFWKVVCVCQHGSIDKHKPLFKREQWHL